MRMKSLPTWALLAAALALAGCSTVGDRQDAMPVTISELNARPDDFVGKTIVVTGYLMNLHTSYQLLEEPWPNCYGQEDARKYLITDLRRDLPGHRKYGPLVGRAVQISGVFSATGNPWGNHEIVSAPTDRIVVGPLKKARMEAVFERACDTRIPIPR